MDKTFRIALIGLLFNMAFSAYHIVFGVMSYSWWLLTVGAYYLMLSCVRFFVLQIKKREYFATKFTGVMLMLLSLPLAGTVILAVVRDRGMIMHEIIMIAMAVYAFTKIAFATVNLVKSRKYASAKLVTLRNISFADACVSIFALQRSMLVSFEGMSEAEILTMNAILGFAVCFMTFLLGLNLIKNKKVFFQHLNHSQR